MYFTFPSARVQLVNSFCFSSSALDRYIFRLYQPFTAFILNNNNYSVGYYDVFHRYGMRLN